MKPTSTASVPGSGFRVPGSELSVPASTIAVARPTATGTVLLRKLFTSGVLLGLVTSAALAVWVLDDLHGLSYYTTPLGVRGYAAGHRLLRPSGPIGQTFGVVGAALMLVPFLYMLRKRFKQWTWAGSLKGWLEVHLFSGIVGPVLVTFHTTFKFNGIVSTAYWSMVLVTLSGFIGRYLYVRIPRTLRGTELSRVELDRQAEALLGALTAASADTAWIERIRAVERRSIPKAGGSIAGLLFGEIGLRWRVRRMAHAIERSRLPEAERHTLNRVMRERLMMLRRIAYLQKTKTAFGLWHVFHVPLVYWLLVIVAIHVGVALYLGYVPFRW